MTSQCEQFLLSVITRNWWQAYGSVGKVPGGELFNAVAALDPLDRTDLRGARNEVVAQNNQLFAATAPAVRMARGFKPNVPTLSEVLDPLAPVQRLELPRLAYALDVVEAAQAGRPLPEPPLGLQLGDTAAANMFAAMPPTHRCAHPDVLPFLRDLTGMLPPANPGALDLTGEDIRRAAQSLNVETTVIRAVAAVESRAGFENGRPALRYELHVFRNGASGFAGTGGIYDRTHPHLSRNELIWWTDPHDRTQAREYSLLYAAMILRDGPRRRYADAWQAASWGRFQVMGFNYAAAGWASIESFVAAMCSSVGAHLDAFVGYVRSRNLAHYLRGDQKNWLAFAINYNKNAADPKGRTYDQKLRDAYIRLGGREPAGVP